MAISFQSVIQLIINSANLLIDHSEFNSRAFLNIDERKGTERELYPFFNVILIDSARRCFGESSVIGVGAGEIGKKQPDCLLILQKGRDRFLSAIEIKGPSKDRSHINRGIESDFNKLIGIGSTINLGVAIGFLLVCSPNVNTQKVITRNGRSLGINIKTKTTQPSA